MIYSLIINGCTDRQLMHTGIFIGQLVVHLPNEIHITANYIHMIISATQSWLCPTIIFNKIHSSNEFITLHSTTNNALNDKAQNYPLKHCCTL